jgi:hypothetical protein
MTSLRTFTTIAALLLNGCGLVPRKVAMDDPQVRLLVKAATSFDRASYGFSRIPQNADVRLELRPTSKYDAMLHIVAKTSRTIAFRKENGRYVWIGEQESFQGPKKYKSEDGIFNESVTLTYEIQGISGYPLNHLNVMYLGENRRLIGRENLTLSDVSSILKEWGY